MDNGAIDLGPNGVTRGLQGMKLVRLAMHTLCCWDVVIASQARSILGLTLRQDASAIGEQMPFPRVRVRSAITTLKSDVPKQSTVYLYGMAVSAEPKGRNGNKLLYACA
jgi:hypothetical protein